MTEDIQETQKSRQERLAGLGEGRGRSKSRRIRSLALGSSRVGL